MRADFTPWMIRGAALATGALLVGGAVGGMVGALLAVPVAAALEVVLEGMQARRVPVAQDPTGVEPTDTEERAEQEQSLPDAGVLPSRARAD